MCLCAAKSRWWEGVIEGEGCVAHWHSDRHEPAEPQIGAVLCAGPETEEASGHRSSPPETQAALLQRTVRHALSQEELQPTTT